MKTSFGYEFKTAPRQLQVEDLERAWKRTSWARFWEMRVGKTAGTVYEIDALAQASVATRFLVVCPKKVIGVWCEMIETHARTPFLINESPMSLAKHPQIVVTNYERVWERHNGKLIANRSLVNWCPEFIVADEAHKIKNRTSNRTKGMHMLGRLAKYRRALTGTPDPTSWADYYSIGKFLDPEVFGTWTQFAERYLLLDWYQRVTAYRNTDELAQKVHSLGSRARRVDWFDVPEVEERTVEVKLPPAAVKLYKDMAKHLYAEYEMRPISAPIVLTKLLRLAQITGGTVPTEDGAGWVRVHNAKLDALADTLEEVLSDAGAKVVVFFKFRAEIEEAARMVTASPSLRGVEVLELHGGTRDVDAVRAHFATAGKRILFSQIAAGSLGIDLSAAETAVFYSWDYDAATYQQARDRIWKPGHGKITVIHLVARHTSDETRLKVVQGKIDRSILLLDRWQELVGTAAA